MPELPEVESVRRGLTGLVGDRIVGTLARDELVYQDSSPPGEVERRLEGQLVRALRRWGKYLLLELDRGWLMFSFRMTGTLTLRQEPLPPEGRTKLLLRFETEDRSLVFTSVRRFSRVYLFNGTTPRQHPRLKKLGPDPMHASEYRYEDFREALANRRGPVKSTLMNQEVLAGVGNIYASEICFRTRIDPRRSVDDLSGRRLRGLYRSVPRILREAVLAGGSSFTDFVGSDGRPGRYHRYHRVYDRAGEPCVNCATTIERLELSSRSTYFCPHCQD